MRIPVGLAFLGILLLTLVAGCGNNHFDRGDDERQVRHHGADIIGPAGGYGAHIEPGPAGQGAYDRGYQTGGGDPQVASVQVTGTRVTPANSPVIDQFNLTLHDVTYRRSPFHITHVGSNTFTAQLKDSDVSTFLNKRPQTGIMVLCNTQMTFTPRFARLTTTIVGNGHDMTVISTGTLQPAGDARIVYVPTTFEGDGAPLSASLQQFVLQQVNPVADLGSLHSAPRVRQVTLGEDVATISGTSMLHNLP